MDWKLIAAATVFGLYVIYRFRPVLAGRGSRASLADARKKIESAKTDAERAEALAAAGDACARSVGRTTGAIGYYLRAMRANPASAELVERAATGLARRPHALEQLLWRRLGSEPWTGDRRAPAVAAVRHLVTLYEGSVKNRTRGRAFEHVLDALGEKLVPDAVKTEAAAPAKDAAKDAGAKPS
jgi:hypothetical protein